ncbi:unnamed protein product [Parascedosporium putredinis]|uniref:Uncharacterized protein n=1 Tax=Parascedosporium putredinis TaxID=1442378 RepID=A0A9P1MBB3_9PEZI|nr:unnamed protein product [Parascedosporium putredinis]CAI7999274.1 unnamed protein product [Parascedosporium putredinis]
MFSQNPLMNGPNYSFSDTPHNAQGNFKEHRFSPYTDNGGSTLAIADRGTTASQDDATLVLSVVGFAADGEALKDRLDAICKMYRYRHGKPISVKACAQRLATILYQKRFFPYYAYAILGGIDEDGTGAVYSYDPVNFKNQFVPGSGEGHALQERERVPLSRAKVENLVKDAFDGAVERHIEVGDALQMMALPSYFNAKMAISWHGDP